MLGSLSGQHHRGRQKSQECHGWKTSQHGHNQHYAISIFHYANAISNSFMTNIEDEEYKEQRMVEKGGP